MVRSVFPPYSGGGGLAFSTFPLACANSRPSGPNSFCTLLFHPSPHFFFGSLFFSLLIFGSPPRFAHSFSLPLKERPWDRLIRFVRFSNPPPFHTPSGKFEKKALVVTFFHPHTQTHWTINTSFPFRC
ncbi:hypothetical protein IE53DRAFT_75868 [Violaceomyces palustris]|uniref:Uncharacterized protein n=1 Tax=Violaceomyces palustris TaxID=1673888 RepID=A0ACD0NYL0_9BASI|nr:hypothetical protein IE53DRAFT_75868 [Violaceomyces palustris]